MYGEHMVEQLQTIVIWISRCHLQCYTQRRTKNISTRKNVKPYSRNMWYPYSIHQTWNIAFYFIWLDNLFEKKKTNGEVFCLQYFPSSSLWMIKYSAWGCRLGIRIAYSKWKRAVSERPARLWIDRKRGNIVSLLFITRELFRLSAKQCAK